jgi:tRNA 2-selenouridine synthase
VHKTLDPTPFHEHMLSPGSCVLDVRSPGEFAKSHLPNALNLPLLNDEERKAVGITYKAEGREKAVSLGLQLVGGKFAAYVEKAQQLSPQRRVMVYCWRGGMRSHIMAWLLDLAGFHVILLKGGYKAWRNEGLAELQRQKNIVVLAGLTGSGKTELLQQLAEQGEQVLNLEELAHHKGSSFGALGEKTQPTQEEFENRITVRWRSFDQSKPVWVENESRFIGKLRIPDVLMDATTAAPVIQVVRSTEERVERILNEYGNFSKEELIQCTLHLAKRMGHERVKLAIDHLENDRWHAWVQILLDYYDKGYWHSIAEHRQKPSSCFLLEKNKPLPLKELIEVSRTLFV